MKPLLFIVMLLISTLMLQAQDSSTSIEGEWINPQSTTKIEIVRKQDHWVGKIVWMAQPNGKDGKPLTDRNNPEPQLRHRPVIGMEFITDLRRNGQEWTGKIYAPRKGQTADCTISLTTEGTLRITVYKGLLSDSKIWTRP